MAGLEYQAVACVVKKQDHLARYGVAALDPYLLSLDILVERFCLDVRTATEGGTIVAERRDPTLDRLLELAWQNLKVQGTRFVRSHVIRERISGLSLRAKSADVAGLQLADLVVTPIGRAVLGKPVRDDYEIVHRKLRRGPKGEADGFGLVILPK
jgi:hypothetical protein